ncbi:MAG: hypothetical protein ACKVWV_00360 [Planctomycetota bacterium]
MRSPIWIVIAGLVLASSPATAPPQERTSSLRRLSTALDSMTLASDAELRAVERAVVELHTIPPSWSVRARRENHAWKPVRANGDATIVKVELAHARLGGRALELSTSLDGEWVHVGSMLFIAQDARTRWAREQYAMRAQFWPPRALAPMLIALERELEHALGPDDVLESVDPMSGDARADDPYARVLVWVANGATRTTAVGALPLPRSCRQQQPYPAGVHGRRAADSVIGEPLTTVRLRDTLAHMRHLRSTIDVGGDVLMSNQPGVDAAMLWLSSERRERGLPPSMLGQVRCSAVIDARSRGTLFQLGDVRVSGATLSALVRETHGAARSSGATLLAVLAFPAHEIEPATIVAVTTPQTSDFGSLSVVACTAWTLADDRSLPPPPAAWTTVAIRCERAPFGRRWTIELADIGKLAFGANVPLFCDVGVEPPAPPTLRGRSGFVVGGIALNAVR